MIIKRDYNSSLGDREGVKFQDFAREIQENVNNAFKSLKGFHSLLVKEIIQANSVIYQVKIFVQKESSIKGKMVTMFSKNLTGVLTETFGTTQTSSHATALTTLSLPSITKVDSVNSLTISTQTNPAKSQSVGSIFIVDFESRIANFWYSSHVSIVANKGLLKFCGFTYHANIIASKHIYKCIPIVLYWFWFSKPFGIFNPNYGDQKSVHCSIIIVDPGIKISDFRCSNYVSIVPSKSLVRFCGFTYHANIIDIIASKHIYKCITIVFYWCWFSKHFCIFNPNYGDPKSVLCSIFIVDPGIKISNFWCSNYVSIVPSKSLVKFYGFTYHTNSVYHHLMLLMLTQ